MADSPAETASPTDEDLLLAAQVAPEGDLRAFEELVTRHQKRILADCRHLTRDPNNTEDLAQEVFLKAFFGLKGFEGRSTFGHWLKRIKVNHCLNHIRRTQGKDTFSIENETAEIVEQLQVAPEALGHLAGLESAERIEEILSAMPATLRIPLVMCDMDELSYEEISAALGIGLSAVKMRIKRGREHFRRLYQGGEAQGAGSA